MKITQHIEVLIEPGLEEAVRSMRQQGFITKMLDGMNSQGLIPEGMAITCLFESGKDTNGNLDGSIDARLKFSAYDVCNPCLHKLERGKRVVHTLATDTKTREQFAICEHVRLAAMDVMGGA
ncbi:MAG TPA: hypothetical protein VG844_10710 [Terracidiphilus sp.]|nr:hypothetical protein [Terracidiphilus sp.]